MLKLLINFFIDDLPGLNQPFVNSVELSEEHKNVLACHKKLIVRLEERLEDRLLHITAVDWALKCHLFVLLGH